MPTEQTSAGPILVVGAGGLVGRHIHAAALAAGQRPQRVDVPWEDPEATVDVLRAAIAELIRDGCADARSGAGSGTPWTVVWAAGAGVVATDDATLERELAVFDRVMSVLGVLAGASRGAFVLISSAGGVYAGSAAPPFTEATTPRPLVPYGRVKLAMEHVAAEHCRMAGLPLAILRLSNVYGPGQRLGKGQGLISQICRSLVSGSPLPVVVSLDTLRDYVYGADVGSLTVAVIGRLHALRPEVVVTKIVASGTPVSVGQLTGLARRISRRPVRTVSVRGQGRGQVLDLRFRSMVWTDLDALLATPLVAGLAATALDVQRRHAVCGSLDD